MAPDVGPSQTGQDSIAQYSTSLLFAELARRQEEGEDVEVRPECGSHEHGNYNTGLHVFALFLILVLSIGACSFPILVRRFPKLPVPHRFLFLSRHFGTGVLIATAFVHLLPTAFVSLTDPCLPPFWTDGYPAMAGFIAMISVLVVVGIEMFFATRGGGHNHAINFDDLEPRNKIPAAAANGHAHSSSRHGLRISGNFRKFRAGSIGSIDGPAGILGGGQETRGDVEFDAAEMSNTRNYSETSPPASPPYNGSPDMDADDFDPLQPAGTTQKGQYQHVRHESNGDRISPALNAPDAAQQQQQPQPDPASEKKMLLQCFILEAGILFHSVFIGMALSVAVGTPFIVLLIAISFHQTFEGLALGSRIAGIEHAFGRGSIKPWLMALAYGTTTPIGQAIGLGVHELYDPASETGLLMVGIMNAVSSGLLLFAGLVELLAEDFLSDASYISLVGRKRIHACCAVVAGAMLMALVGAWA